MHSTAQAERHVQLGVPRAVTQNPTCPKCGENVRLEETHVCYKQGQKRGESEVGQWKMAVPSLPVQNFRPLTSLSQVVLTRLWRRKKGLFIFLLKMKSSGRQGEAECFTYCRVVLQVKGSRFTWWCIFFIEKSSRKLFLTVPMLHKKLLNTFSRHHEGWLATWLSHRSGWSTSFVYLSKSINTTVQVHSVRIKSAAFWILLNLSVTTPCERHRLELRLASVLLFVVGTDAASTVRGFNVRNGSQTLACFLKVMGGLNRPSKSKQIDPSSFWAEKVVFTHNMNFFGKLASISIICWQKSILLCVQFKKKETNKQKEHVLISWR